MAKNMAPKGKKPFMFKIKVNVWSVLFLILAIFFIAPLILTGIQLTGNSNKVEISQLLSDIREEKVDKVLVENEKLLVTYKDGSTKFSTKEQSQSFDEIF